METYDANGSITDITDELASLDRSYDYDKLDRLKAHTGPDGNYTYTYRLNGNRKTKTIAGATTTYNYYPGTNRLNTLTGAESENRDYDANGNTTAIDAEVYTYNAANRLASYRPSAGGGLTEYRYNGLGERVFKNRSGSKQRFVYDGNGLLLHERGSMGTRDYIYLNGEPVALVKNGDLYYIHNDHLGRPEAASDANGVSAWSIEANAWSSDTPIGGLWAFNLRFPGQYFDTESGRYYNYFRTYDPSTGRYLESDPIGLAGGLNTYAYVAGNPLAYIDPYGLQDAAAAAMSPAVILGTRIFAGGICAIPLPGARVVGGLIFAATFPTADTPIDDDSSPISDDTSGGSQMPDPDDFDDGLTSAATVKEELNKLPDSAGRNVSSVGSEADLQSVFGRMTRGGKVDSPSSYPGKTVLLRDGTRVGMRPTSQSGGATIDIRFPNGSTAKVHITGG